MGGKVLLAVTFWLTTLSQALGEPDYNAKSNSAVALDNESAESAPRLYSKGQFSVYASAVPYSPHAFKGHSVITASSQIAPVRTANHQNSGIINLKDSYGKYVQTHHPVYSPSYPQQFVPLQDLPPHLAQPLVSAASPNFDFKAAPNFFYGPQSYKIQEVHIPADHAAKFGSISQPLVYLDDLKSFESTHLHTPSHEVHAPDHKLTIATLNRAHYSNQPSKPSSYQLIHFKQPSHSSNHKIHNSNEQSHHQPTNQFNQASHHPKQTSHHLRQLSHNLNQVSHQTYPSVFQILHEKPTSQKVNSFIKDTKQLGSLNEAGQIQASPAQTYVTAIVNGKKTVLSIETKPPVPYLDLNLLEPLTFDNPLVPQLQHYLPKVKGATYHKLPSYNALKGKNDQKQFVLTKNKIYHSGTAKSKTYPEPKQTVKPENHDKPSKPGITVKGYPNSGDYSYEINTPNHKETYNEQVVKFNKETNMKPVEFSYNEQSTKEPEVYSYVKSSKEPLKVTHVEYNSDDDGPKNLVYNLSPDEKEEQQSNKASEPAYQESDEDSGESFESEEDILPPKSSCDRNCESNELPKYPQSDQQNGQQESPKYLQQQIVPETRGKEYYHSSAYHIDSPKHTTQPNYYVKSQAPPPQKQTNQNVFIVQETPKFQISHEGPIGPAVYHETPRQSHHLKVEHREQEHQRPHQHTKHQIVQSFAEPLNKHQVIQSFAQPLNLYQPIIHEYEEEIRLLPEMHHELHTASIKVNPSQHHPNSHTVQPHVTSKPTNNGEQDAEKKSWEQRHHAPTQPHSSEKTQPNIQEKSKHIIVSDYQESPDEKHTQLEQAMAEISDREENSEEDFEKAYKESALGFPAYDHASEDIEKDIFDPDSQETPKYHSEYNAESSPFQEYQSENDKFPKFARLAYKDSKDNNQEDYFLDYAVHNPESYTDRVKSKVDYYKMFKKNRPQKSYNEQDDDRKGKKNEKFTFAPSFDFFTPSSPKPKQSKSVAAKYEAAPIRYVYDHSQETPRDSRAFASRSNNNKYKNQFVEPQLQYGFEPITASVLFNESETAASNNSPKSENPNTKKKMFTEKWYMMKTSTSSKPS